MAAQTSQNTSTDTNTDGFLTWLGHHKELFLSQLAALFGAAGFIYTAYSRWREVDFGKEYNALLNDIIHYNILVQIAFLLFAIVTLNTHRRRSPEKITEDDKEFIARMRYYLRRVPKYAEDITVGSEKGDENNQSKMMTISAKGEEVFKKKEVEKKAESYAEKKEKEKRVEDEKKEAEKFDENLLKLRNVNEDFFLRYWLGFYVTLLVLYILFANVTLLDARGIIPRLQFAHFTIYEIANRSIEVFLNNLSSTCLLVCFFVCREPLSYNNLNNVYEHRRKGKWSKVFWIGLVSSIAASLLHVIWMAYVSPDELPFISWDYEEKAKTFERMVQADTVVKAISGIYACTAIGLLIGRLDDKFARIPSGLVSVLFIYAAVQPLFAFFEDNLEIKTMVLFITLIAKVYFFLIILYMYKTGRLGELLTIFPVVRHIVDKYRYDARHAKNPYDISQ